MRFNHYMKKNVNLILITFSLTIATMLAVNFIVDSIESGREDEKYANYNGFCIANELRFFDDLALLPLNSGEKVSFSMKTPSDILAELLDRDKLSAIESQQARLREQIDLLQDIKPPDNLIYLHWELIFRLDSASKFNDILLSLTSANPPLLAESQSAVNSNPRGLAITASAYFRSLDRILLLMDMIPVDDLGKLSDCTGYGAGITRQQAENYIIFYRSFLSSGDFLNSDTEFNPPILVQPKKNADPVNIDFPAEPVSP